MHETHPLSGQDLRVVLELHLRQRDCSNQCICSRRLPNGIQSDGHASCNLAIFPKSALLGSLEYLHKNVLLPLENVQEMHNEMLCVDKEEEVHSFRITCINNITITSVTNLRDPGAGSESFTYF